MALTKPILLLTPAFDSLNEHTFYFNVIGGSQVVRNRLVIRDNKTNDVVYTEIQESFKYEHIVNAKELRNGTYYNAVITTFDAEGNESQPSIPIQFWCYTTPTLEFTNLPIGNIIANASFDFTFEYNQLEGEKLNSFKMNLYDSAQSLVSTSGSVYVQNGTPLYTGNYLFAGFDNNTAYFIELIGTTVNNTIVNTGLIEITVSYTRPDIFTLMELTNNCEEGYISIKSNLTLIEGKSNPSPPVYIDGKEVDLTANGSWVEFDDGYTINDDFLARIWFRNPNVYQNILTFSNTKGQTITVRFMEGYEDEEETLFKAYVDIYVKSLQEEQYYIFSNYIDILAKEEYYVLWLKNKKNIFSLELGKK